METRRSNRKRTSSSSPPSSPIFSISILIFIAAGAALGASTVGGRQRRPSSGETPVEVSLETVSSTVILVAWKPPPNVPLNLVDGYQIAYKATDGEELESLSTSADRRSYPLSELQKGTTYNVKVAALVDTNRTLAFTGWVTTATFDRDLEEHHVPGAPASVQAVASTKDIFVSWTPPVDSDRIRVRGYVIGWGLGISDEHSQMQEGRETSYSITDLRPSSEYVLSVRAFNEVGDGPPGYTSVRTLRETGSSQKKLYPPIGLKAIVLSSTTAVLYWSDTTLLENQEDEQRYYTARYSSAGGKERFVNSTEQNCMIDDLTPDTDYEFAVRVQSGQQQSKFSMTAVNRTSEAAPGSSPRDLTIVASTKSDPSVIHLHWQPPKAPNGEVTGYVIFYTTDNKLFDRDWVVEAVVGDHLSYTVKGLKPNTVYYFKVQARNDKGYGPLSPYVTFTTTPGSAVSTNTLYVVIVAISVVTLLLLIVVSVLLCKSRLRRSRTTVVRKHKGYTPAATSPAAGSGSKGKGPGSGVRGDLKPPDLWIHHHDQMELKGLDKGQQQQQAQHHQVDAVRNPGWSTAEQSYENREKKAASSYSTSLYDDVNKSATSPTDTSVSMISGGSSTARRNMRAKTMMLDSQQQQQLQLQQQQQQQMQQSTNSLEPSTGLSRPIYPKPNQYNNLQPRAHVTMDDGNHHLYDPVASPLLSMTGSMTGAGQLCSNNVSYSIANNSASPNSSNTLGKVPISQHPLKSFVPSGPSIQSNSQSKHISAVRPQMATSPQKKPPMVGGGGGVLSKNPKGFTRISDSLKKEEDAVSTYSTEELNQEMANLEGLMKDLSAITASEFEMNP